MVFSCLLFAETARYAGATLEGWSKVAYLIAAIVLLVGLGRIARGEYRRFGVFLLAVAMALAAGVNLWKLVNVEPKRGLLIGAVAGAVAIGSFVGLILGMKSRATAAAKLAAILCAFSGLAAALVAGATVANRQAPTIQAIVAIEIAAILGVAAFSGGIVVCLRMDKAMPSDGRVAIPGRLAGVAFFAGAIGLAAWQVNRGVELVHPEQYDYLIVFVALAAAGAGACAAASIRARDSMAAVGMLTFCSALATAATGFIFDDEILIAAGGLVAGCGFSLAREHRTTLS